MKIGISAAILAYILCSTVILMFSSAPPEPKWKPFTGVLDAPVGPLPKPVGPDLFGVRIGMSTLAVAQTTFFESQRCPSVHDHSSC